MQISRLTALKGGTLRGRDAVPPHPPLIFAHNTKSLGPSVSYLIFVKGQSRWVWGRAGQYLRPYSIKR